MSGRAPTQRPLPPAARALPAALAALHLAAGCARLGYEGELALDVDSPSEADPGARRAQGEGGNSLNDGSGGEAAAGTSTAGGSGLGDATGAAGATGTSEVAEGSNTGDPSGTGASSSGSTGSGGGELLRALAWVTPGLGWHDSTPTTFTGDASGSVAGQPASEPLSYSWDWDGDGNEDDTGATSDHVYAAPGTYEVALRVTGADGAQAFDTFVVVVAPRAAVHEVTTAVDESDAEATPAAPGGAGLSLREALSHAASIGSNQNVLVPPGTQISLTDELVLTSGVTVVADGAAVDGESASPSSFCLDITEPDVRVFGLEVRNCRRHPIRVLDVGGVWLSRLDVHDNPTHIAASGSGNRFGPGNLVRRSSTHGMTTYGNWRIERSRFEDNVGRALDLSGVSLGGTVVGNVFSGNALGTFLAVGFQGGTIVHNVFHANAGSGLTAGNGASDNVVQNNAFSSNGAYGIEAPDAAFAMLSHNAYFENAAGPCSACSPSARSITADPGFVDPQTGDFHLLATSPLVDGGASTSEDTNGPAPSLFSGAAPDIGAYELP